MNENMTSLLTGGIPAAIGAILGYLFGPWDAVIMVLLCVVSLDYITGSSARPCTNAWIAAWALLAFSKRSLSSCW